MDVLFVCLPSGNRVKHLIRHYQGKSNCDTFHNLVPFVQFKKCEKTPMEECSLQHY